MEKWQIIILMEKDKCSIIQVIYMKDNGIIIKKKDKGNLLNNLVKFLKESLKRTNTMEMEK
jgi:hypothetical protein